MIKGVLGKYIQAMKQLRNHRLQSLMAERLSKETLQRLCERLCHAAEGKLKGSKHLYYDKLKQNKLLFDKKKAICRRV